MKPGATFKRATPDSALLQTVRCFLPVLGDLSCVRYRWLRTILAFGLLLHQFLLMLMPLGIFAEPISIFRFSEVVSKMHGVMVYAVHVVYFLWWRKRELLADLAEEATRLMFQLEMQVSLDPRVHRKIVKECHARHFAFMRSCWAIEVFTYCTYIIAPILSYLRDPTPQKRLKMPHGMRDPFPIPMQSEEWEMVRALLFFLFCVSTLINIIIMMHGLLIMILLFDTLKTLFHLCGLAFRHLSPPASRRHHELISCIRFHQELFRLSSRIKILLEPVISLVVVTNALYTVVSGVSASQSFSFDAFKFAGVILSNLIPMFLLFTFPALASHTATEIGNQVYGNGGWVAWKYKYATLFQFIITRAHRKIKFRILNCWVLSQENFLKYMQNLYELFLLIRLVTSRSHITNVASY